jgi:signal transduction histidine kinase
MLRLGQGLPRQVFKTGKPKWVKDGDQYLLDLQTVAGNGLNLQSAAAFPVMVKEEPVAVLELLSHKVIELDSYMLDTLTYIGIQLGYIIERKRWEKQLSDMIMAHQQQLGQELHDGLIQQVAGLGMMIQSLHHKLKAKTSPEADTVAELVKITQDTQEQARAAIKGLRPVDVDAGGLMAALEELLIGTEKLSRIKCNFKCARPVLVENNNTATQLFLIAQEAVRNAARHAKAKNITVGLETDNGQVTLQISDDGVGISEGTVDNKGMGLRIMRYRAGLIGASLDVQSENDQGTIITCKL